MSKIAVIGSGFSSLSCASYLAKAGHDVTIYEKNETPGGRCRQFKAEGFTFDMGPSWYWMPEVFDNFFQDFGFKTSDFYELIRLSPSYEIHFGKNDRLEIPSDLEELKQVLESLETGASEKLDSFLADAEAKYDAGMNRFVHKPSLSIFEFAEFEIIKGLLKLDLLKAFSKHVRSYFSHPKIIQLLEFPVLFLGATPQEIPALYSLMNYADLKGGTWYPMKGMHEIILAMVEVAEKEGVKIVYQAEVKEITIDKGATKRASGLVVNEKQLEFDFIVAGADYHHVETKLIPKEYRNYSDNYWESRKMAPSCLIYYIGLDKKLENIHHHNLFFDTDFNAHAAEIYETKVWPENPLFYVCAPSVTDETVAPNGCENLFLLVPIAPGIKDTEEDRELIFNKVIDRMEQLIDQSIKKSVIFKQSYALNNFVEDYHAFKGNAYGLANTLRQTAFLKPKIKNKRISNLLYTGQLTVPGPGVPPSIISGKVVANYIQKLIST